MNAAIYARVSTDLQAEKGYSLQTQIDACTQKAKEMGAVAIKTYVDDGYSGSYLERPALDKLRDALDAKLYDMVVIYDQDRLSRTLSHQLLLTEEIEKSGAQLVFVSSEYKRTPEGILFYQIKGAFSAYEKEKIRERMMRGKRGKLRQGKPIQDSGVYGYDWDEEKGKYIINQEEAAIIRMIYDTYLTGKSIYTTADALNRQNIPSASGKIWRYNVVHTILTREMYTGEYWSNKIYHKRVGNVKEERIQRDEKDWIRMEAPAIIDKDTFAKVRQKLTANRHDAVRWDYTQSLLQGILYCPYCGRRKTLLSDRKQGKRYYCCVKRQGDTRIICHSRHAEVVYTDMLFWEILTQICRNENTLKGYIEKKSGKKLAKAGTENGKLQERLRAIAREKEVVMNWFSDGLLSQEQATQKLTALKNEETKLAAKIVEADPQHVPEINLQDIVEKIKNCPLDVASKRAVVLQYIEKVYFTRTDSSYKKKEKAYRVEFNIVFKNT